MPPIIISLEGNIGAGKSTFAEQLQKQFPQYNIVLEPVAEWLIMKDKEGKTRQYFDCKFCKN